MYSCVGIRAGRFVCFILTLEDVISEDVYNRMCSIMLDYERRGL